MTQEYKPLPREPDERKKLKVSKGLPKHRLVCVNLFHFVLIVKMILTLCCVLDCGVFLVFCLYTYII